MNFADSIVIRVRHKQVKTIGGDVGWVIEPRRGASAIGTTRSAARQRSDDPGRYHDFADFMIAGIGNIEVSAIAGDAGWVRETRRGTGAIVTTP